MRPVRRLLITFALALGTFLALTPAAMAADGVGLWGRTDDKVVTFWGFGIMIFFTVLSLIQGRLDSRRERLRRDLERLRR